MRTNSPSALTAVTERPEPTVLDSVGLLSQHHDPFWESVVIRRATASDTVSLAPLAQLDSANPPVGETLIGEQQGQPVVAASLSQGMAKRKERA